jgi:hypothetical protein
VNGYKFPEWLLWIRVGYQEVANGGRGGTDVLRILPGLDKTGVRSEAGDLPSGRGGVVAVHSWQHE